MNEKDFAILYVDDERANRVVFEQTFKRRFRIICASSGHEALDLLKRETISVLVTDQRMPQISGNELLLRAKELYPSVIRVVITAYSDLDPILRAVNDGLVARYIVKPWTRSELEQILAWGVEAYSVSKENSVLQLRLMQTERLVTLGSIGAAVLHDINQPLSYMTTNTERLQQLSAGMPALEQLLKDHGDELVDQQDRVRLDDLAVELKDIVDDMLAGCEVMQSLTGSIRKLLRPSASTQSVATDPLPIIRYAMSVCQEIAQRAHGSIAYDGPTTLPKIKMGSTEFTQVMINVIANACQALELRGEREEPGETIVAATPEGTDLIIRIRDNGPGIPKAILDKVGTPFFSTRKEGTGLGVAQCRRLIEKDRGSFQLESEEGKGTEVIMRLQRIADLA